MQGSSIKLTEVSLDPPQGLNTLQSVKKNVFLKPENLPPFSLW